MKDISRRHFLKESVITGTVITLAVSWYAVQVENFCSVLCEVPCR
jgi:hypothetical protein